jgi:hypothetical protein
MDAQLIERDQINDGIDCIIRFLARSCWILLNSDGRSLAGSKRLDEYYKLKRSDISIRLRIKARQRCIQL